jgi:hypothetical protein
MSVSGAVRGTDDCCLWERRTARLLYTDCIGFRVACNESVHCAHAFGVGSSKSSSSTMSCACVSVAFVSGIISLPVDSITTPYNFSS